MTDRFDPTAPLPGVPDPWASSGTPEHRAGPPYVMTDMIAAEPAFTERLLDRLDAADGAVAQLANVIRTAVEAGEPVVFTGCGTSEHGAIGAAEIVADALRSAGVAVRPGAVISEQAFDAAIAPARSGVVIGVSHEGGSRATNDAMRAAAAAGARVGTITVTRRSPGGALAEPDLVVETDELDQSWCHTVAYLSALLAATALGARISGQTVRASEVRELVAAGASSPSDAERLASVVGESKHVIVSASGADRAAGRELVLKIEEASWLPSAFRELETLLHGHLPATGSDTSLVLLLTDRSGRDERIARARQMLAAAAIIGVRAGAIVSRDVSASIDDSLTPAGRIVVPDAPSLPNPVAALLSTATALQLLTERIARVRGTNPDAIRRDDDRYRRSSAAAE